jgi:hypothetical protein
MFAKLEVIPGSFLFHAYSLGSAIPIWFSASRGQWLSPWVTQYAEGIVLPSERVGTNWLLETSGTVHRLSRILLECEVNHNQVVQAYKTWDKSEAS